MGNTGSRGSTTATKSKLSLSVIINRIASSYILTQNFKDLTNLSDPNYCNKLVLLTSKIFEKNLNDIEIQYLAQRVKDGVVSNIMTKDNVYYFNKDNLNNLGVKNPTTKRRLCIGIAKFYIKISHLFAAIVKTINPVYSYTDYQGNLNKFNLLTKDKIPPNVDVKIKNFNICSERINSLVNYNNYNVDNNTMVYVKPKFCDMNRLPGSNDTKKLMDEPGIPELKNLYLDKYDFDTGLFKGMSDNMKKIYSDDVELFYKVFTGNDKIPMDNNGNKTIKNFNDIPLKDFHNSKGCQKEQLYTKKYKGTLKEKLFSNYANHIKTMMSNTTTNRDKLISTLDKIFVYYKNPISKDVEIIINPELNDKKLDIIISETRKTIVDLYIQCEKDYITGLEIFESIVEKQIMDTSIQQVKQLEEDINELQTSNI
jgi:hypothetical protein